MIKPPLSMMKAVPASLLINNSCMALFSALMSSSMSWGRVGIVSDFEWQRFLRPSSGDFTLAFRDEFLQQQTSNHVQGFEDPVTLVGAGREGGDLFLPVIEQVFHELGRGHVG